MVKNPIIQSLGESQSNAFKNNKCVSLGECTPCQAPTQHINILMELNWINVKSRTTSPTSVTLANYDIEQLRMAILMVTFGVKCFPPFFLEKNWTAIYPKGSMLRQVPFEIKVECWKLKTVPTIIETIYDERVTLSRTCTAMCFNVQTRCFL